MFSKKNKKKQIKKELYSKYDVSELEHKARKNEPMTSDEFAVLQMERQKELINRILRVVGVVAFLLIAALAIGSCLYPYSLFNLFGNGDRFWDCWSHLQYHLCESDLRAISAATGGTAKISWDSGTEGLGSGWVSIGDMAFVVFQGTSAKLNFIVLGAWSFVVVATITLISLIVACVYITAYSIRDLIAVVKHVKNKTSAVIVDVGNITTESVQEGIGQQEEEEVEKKKDDDKIVVDENGEKQLFSNSEDLKKEADAELKGQPKLDAHRNEKDKTAELSSDQLDALLSGEDINQVKK